MSSNPILAKFLVLPLITQLINWRIHAVTIAVPSLGLSERNQQLFDSVFISSFHTSISTFAIELDRMTDVITNELN